MDRLLHRAEAFLLLTIIVFCHFKARLMTCIYEGFEQRIVASATLNMQRTIRSAPAVLSAMRVFHSLEIGQHIGIGPAARATLRPVIVIAGMATHIDHAVDRRRAANHFATRRDQAASTNMRLGLGRKSPIISFHIHGEGESGRHLDQRSDVRSAKFDHDNRMSAVFGEAIGHS
ncbi:hypothetical protein D3C80_294320 [compost metagenome]